MTVEAGTVDPASQIEYLAPADHGHQGSHRIAVAGHTVLVKGDGRTSTRKRYQAAFRAYQEAVDRDAVPEIGLQLVIGALVLAGATNIDVDGTPLFDTGRTHVTTLVIDITSDGGTTVTTTGGGE